VGGTKTASLRLDGDGRILARDVRPTPAGDEASILATMVTSAEAVMDPAVATVGIAAAGLVESDTGVLRFAPNLAWRDVPLASHVAGALGVTAWADNDNTAATWGEFRAGAARRVRDLLFVGVGTGIGGGIVIDGSLVRGAHGFAGEIGHIVVEPDGPRCGCGNRGCWEQVASGSAIARAGRGAVRRHPYSELVARSKGDPKAVTGVMVTEAARAGDTASCGILVEAGNRLGQGIAGLVNVLDPELVIVGGGVSGAGELVLAPARDAYERTVEGFGYRPQVPIVAALLGSDAGAIGAGLLALERADAAGSQGQ
jgi:glucokinase